MTNLGATPYFIIVYYHVHVGKGIYLDSENKPAFFCTKMFHCTELQS